MVCLNSKDLMSLVIVSLNAKDTMSPCDDKSECKILNVSRNVLSELSPPLSCNGESECEKNIMSPS